MLKKFFTLRAPDGHIGKKGLLGKLVVLGIAAKLLLTLGTFGWLLYSTLADPLKVLPKPETELVAAATPLPANAGRTVQHVTLVTKHLGQIGIAVSLPDPLPAGKLPLLLVLGGLGTGENNIRTITEAGNNAIIGYDWPIPVRLPDGFRLVTSLPDFYHEAMTVPGQVVSALGWLLAQGWADSSRVSLLGFSLGSLAAPAIQDVAQQHGIAVGWTILAYGGAPLGQLFADNPHIKPALLRAVLGPVIDLLLRPLQPQLHLPRLHGRFLVMEGENDALMAPDLRANLRNAVPEPKDVVTFPGDHMGVGPGQLELLQLIIATSRSWLVTNKAVNL